MKREDKHDRAEVTPRVGVPGDSGRRQWLAHLLAWLAVLPCAMAGEDLRVTCSPRTFEVVPGEPIRVELTVEAHSAAPVQWHLPAHSLLHLRAIEKHPVRRTPAGAIVHKRVVIWQALEPGTVKLSALFVEAQGRRLSFPEITIVVRDPG